MTTWFITGCSTGLGRALAEAVVARGEQLVVTARDAARVQDIADRAPDRVLAAALDVTDHTGVAEVVERAEQRFGGIDVLVNNAGYGYRSAIEEGDDADVERLFATNVHGALAVTRAVLPGMRARRSGTIVNVSSIGARQCPPGSGYYAASKAALEAATAALRKEVEPLGITAFTVEPGAFRTDFAGRSLTQSARAIDDYAGTAGKRRKENDTSHGTQPGDPERAARAVLTAVEDPHPPALLLLGSDAVAAVTGVLREQLAEIERWSALSTTTDFGGHA